MLFSLILQGANLVTDKLAYTQKTKQNNGLPILPKYLKFQLPTAYNLEHAHQKQAKQENLSNVTLKGEKG